MKNSPLRTARLSAFSHTLARGRSYDFHLTTSFKAWLKPWPNRIESHCKFANVDLRRQRWAVWPNGVTRYNLQESHFNTTLRARPHPKGTVTLHNLSSDLSRNFVARLQHKFHETLRSVTCPEINLSRNVLLQSPLHEIETTSAVAPTNNCGTCSFQGMLH